MFMSMLYSSAVPTWAQIPGWEKTGIVVLITGLVGWTAYSVYRMVRK
jgi:hypothetical protein